MKIVKIDSKDVDEHPENYNSYFHTAIEAPDFSIPTEIPQHYTRWLPLISQSQLIPPQLIHTFALTPTQGRLLLSAAQASIHTRELNRIYAEELSDTVIPTLSSLTSVYNNMPNTILANIGGPQYACNIMLLISS